MTALVHNDPYIVVVASDIDDDPDGFNLRLTTNLPDAGAVQAMLEKTLRAMP